METCFFNPKTKTLIDGVRPDGRGLYGGKTKEELEAEYGSEVVVMDTHAAHKIHCDSFKTEPSEITKDQFWYYLEVLPPCKWVNGRGAESFFMSERTTGNITKHLVRIGERYYQFEDEDNMTHEAKVEKCLPLHRKLTQGGNES